MIETIVALGAAALLILMLWRHDSAQPSAWEDLLSPAGKEAHEFLRRKFAAEQSALAWSCQRQSVAAGAQFLAGLVPDRLALLRRLSLYSRMAAAVMPAPQRLRLRLLLLRRSFLALTRAGPSPATLEELKALDAETLESCLVLVSSLSAPLDAQAQKPMTPSSSNPVHSSARVRGGRHGG